MTDNRETRTYGEHMPLHSQCATYDGFRSVRLLNDDIGLATTTYSYKLSYDEVQEAAERIALMWNLHLGESVEELRHRYLDAPLHQPNVLALAVTGQTEIEPGVTAADLGANAEPEDDGDACPACGGASRMGPFFPGGRSTICGNCTSPSPQSNVEGASDA